ncbi:MAG: signal peptidase I [Rhodobacteraceae bacterium]|nr:signal peptidase I [Paracoccaceae bacterium]
MRAISSFATGYASGFDWSGRTGRRRFALFAVLWFACMLAAKSVWKSYGGPMAYHWLGLPTFLAFAALVIPFAGHIMRRLNDAGRSGWWAALLISWPTTALLAAYLCVAPTSQVAQRPTLSLMRNIGWALAAVMALLFLLRLFLAPFYLPTGSAKPGLLPGDFLVITHGRRPPARGAVLVYEHPVSGQTYITRVIGLPGDTVRLIDGAVWLNGTAVAREQLGLFTETMQPQALAGALPRCSNGAVGLGAQCHKQLWRETLPNGTSYDVLDINQTNGDNTGLFTVPEGHIFFIGDNRDNAIDSRMPLSNNGIGFVPIENVIGRARMVLFSASGASLLAFWNWRAGRYFEVIQ